MAPRDQVNKRDWGQGLRLFHWLCASDVPAACDLRRCGWALVPDSPAPLRGVAIAHRDSVTAADWAPLVESAGPNAGNVLLLGVIDPCERARLLRQGFGDVMADGIALAEVGVRAERIARRARLLPASLDIGALKLDLLARDGFVKGRPLGLHPREFALAWRLAERKGAATGKAELLGNVWQLRHVPETNSLAVHISRLRAKLAIAGLVDMIHTVPGLGYALALRDADIGPAIPMLTNDSHLGDHTMAGNGGTAAEDSPHELRVSRE